MDVPQGRLRILSLMHFSIVKYLCCFSSWDVLSDTEVVLPSSTRVALYTDERWAEPF